MGTLCAFLLADFGFFVLFASFSQGLRPGSKTDVLTNLTKELARFFGSHAFRSPACAFFLKLTVYPVADEKIAVLAYPVFSSRVFAVSDTGI